MPAPRETATAPTETLTVDGVTFALRRSARRRTIAITIPREGPPIVAVPARCSRRRAEEAVRGKLAWVRRKLGERVALAQLPPHRYEAGERFPWRGREYGLLIVDDNAATTGRGDGRAQLAFDLAGADVDDVDADGPLCLRDGHFELARARRRDGRVLFEAWYRRRATEVLNARIAHFAALVGVVPPRVTVKDMRSRWGSCSAKGRVSLHWGLALLDPALLDYVVVHELCHLLELNHQPAFWRRVEAVLPDWRERRTRLRGESVRDVI